MFFARFFRRSETPTETVSAPETSPETADRSSSDPSARPEASRTEPVTTENDSELFAEMQRILGGSAELLRIPSRALLSVLPEPLRGEAYRGDAIPEDASIELDRVDLLDQLRRGRVVYPLDTLATMLPPGWVRADADTLVELNLADVVEALPPGLLHGAEQLDEDTIEAAQMRDYFRPEPEEPVAEAAEAAPGVQTPAAAAAATLPSSADRTSLPAAPAAPRRRRPRPVPPPWAWNGVEKGRDAGAQTIDLNRARIEDLVLVPGLGRTRARAILAWRDRNGPFRGIYDLAEMPGIGRRLFQRATGLNPAVTKRHDRHAQLTGWLGLPAETRPGLNELIERLQATLELEACVLADAEGIALAISPPSSDRSALMAAVTPKLFRRTRRYLAQLAPGGGDVFVLPGPENPLALLRAGRYYLVACLKPDAAWQETVAMLTRISAELEWLLGPRLVVYGSEPTEQGGIHGGS